MAICPRVLTALFLSLFLLTACGGSRQNSPMSSSTCGSNSASQGVQINQVTAVNCSSTAANSQTRTGYAATLGSSLPAMQTTAPVPGGRAVATANGYTYQQAPAAAQNNPYADAYFPTGSYGTGYAANTGYGTGYAANTGYGTGYAANTGYGTGYAANTGYGTGYAANTGYGTGYIQYNVNQAQRNQVRR